MSAVAHICVPRTELSALQKLETPCLVLDHSRLERNAEMMRERCRHLGVVLRPHLKTSKSLEIAHIADAGIYGPITVSTLKEAEYFAKAGYRDIMYAVAVAPSKLTHIDRIQRETGARIFILVDSTEVAKALVAISASFSSRLVCLIEIDCGENRSGIQPVAEEVLPLARVLQSGVNISLEGVMTHAGHSYSFADRSIVCGIAETERKTAVEAANILRNAGFGCPIVSVGSTPTVLFAESLSGITEVRCGIYLFWDLAQLSRDVCKLDDIAVSVLASVIGHNRSSNSVIIDAGALALSKDIGANTYLPDVKFGYVCDPLSLKRIGSLSVDSVHQEHGAINVPDGEWFDRLPIGSLVRIIPNHACMTCAAYDRYEVVRENGTMTFWPKINGW